LRVALRCSFCFFELLEELFFTLLLESFEIVEWRTFRLGRGIDYVAGDVPLLSRSDLDFDTLANEGFSRLASEAVGGLLKDNFGIGFGVSLQLR
jgi:hypothetical protein